MTRLHEVMQDAVDALRWHLEYSDYADPTGFARKRDQRTLRRLQVELAALEPADPVAVIGPTYQLFWADSAPIAVIAARHNLRVGSLLYAAPPLPTYQDSNVPNKFSTRELNAFVDMLVDYVADGNVTIPGLTPAQARETGRRDTERHVMKVIDAVHAQCGGKR